MVLAVIFLFVSDIAGMFNKGSTGNVVKAEMIDAGDSVKIPLEGISKDAQYFTYNDAGVDVEFFVVKDEKVKETSSRSLDTTGSAPERRQSFLERMKNPMKRQVSNAKRIVSLEERREYATSVDAAVAFGKMIRSTFGKDAEQ